MCLMTHPLAETQELGDFGGPTCVNEVRLGEMLH